MFLQVLSSNLYFKITRAGIFFFLGGEGQAAVFEEVGILVSTVWSIISERFSALFHLYNFLHNFPLGCSLYIILWGFLREINFQFSSCKTDLTLDVV